MSAVFTISATSPVYGDTGVSALRLDYQSAGHLAQAAVILFIPGLLSDRRPLRVKGVGTAPRGANSTLRRFQAWRHSWSDRLPIRHQTNGGGNKCGDGKGKKH